MTLVDEEKRSFRPGGYELTVKRSYAGLGLFTEDPIARDACIVEYHGRVLTEEELAKSKSRYLFVITEKKTIDGSARDNKARYMNHSCRPNCEAWIHRGRVFLFARRAIKAGEELTYDYGKEYFEGFFAKTGCKCAKCRGE